MAAIKSSGNVFAGLGFDAEEAVNLKLRSQLMIAADKALIEKKLTQQAAAKVLGISQPRVNDLLRGKTEKFAIDSLVNILTKLGYEVMLRIA